MSEQNELTEKDLLKQMSKSIEQTRELVVTIYWVTIIGLVLGVGSLVWAFIA